MAFENLGDLFTVGLEAARPSENITVTEAAQRYHIIRRAGMHSGPWSSDKTPYMVEPQNLLTSLDYKGMIFVGPARTGKSAMVLNWLSHSVIVDPANMMIVAMSRDTAREWSNDDLELFLRHSPELRRRLIGPQGDNTYDKTFTNGQRTSLTWPTITNLSGKTIPRLFLMDYDRMPDSIGGQGDAWSQTLKRAETYGRFGMCVAEASPGREIDDPAWIRKTPHQAPPAKGILGLYNDGDRRRWYWECPECRDHYEPEFSLLKWPESEDEMECAEGVYLMCPCCGFATPPSMKDELNQGGRWVRDGMVWLPESDQIVARPGMKPARSDIASFWLKGPAAGFNTWGNIVLKWVRANKAYDETQDEEKLRATTMVDHGEPYLSKSRIGERLPEEVKGKCEWWGSTAAKPTIPLGVRFLIATVDVQKNCFVCQVQGFTDDGDVVIIEPFKIRWSTRVDGAGEKLPIDPASFSEDWDQMVEDVLSRTYELSDGSGRRMRIYMAGCDSGGLGGVTHQAYGAWRRLRDAPSGERNHRRFALIKGHTTLGAPRAYVTWPDAKQKDDLSAARGDVPVVLLQSNQMKDQVSAMIGRRVAQPRGVTGGGMLRFPDWTPDYIYKQITHETKTPKGWVNEPKRNNEAWDLAYYALGLANRPFDKTCPLATIGFEKMTFANPPGWAEEWDANDLVFDPRAEVAKKIEKKKSSGFADLGRALS